MDDYIDEFSELVEEAGYSDGLSIVMKFRKGPDRDIVLPRSMTDIFGNFGIAWEIKFDKLPKYLGRWSTPKTGGGVIFWTERIGPIIIKIWHQLQNLH